MKHTMLFVTMFTSVSIAHAQTANQSASLAIPATPKSVPGQCHALVNVPAKLISKIAELPKKEAGETLEVIPAKYKWVEKQVPIVAEEKTMELIPATYKTVEEQIVVEPERKEYKITPAKFQEVTEKVIVKPAMRVWHKSSDGVASLNGEVMRLIEVPTTYKTITKRKIVTPPQLSEVLIPAKYATVKKKVIDTPASTREVVIPAKFKTIRIKQEVTKSQEVRTPTPPLMQKITQYEIAQPAQLKWERVPCDSDLSVANIIAIQKGLRAAGYNVTTDGQFGRGSRVALEKFQASKNLAKGAITIESMKALGVKIN
ncbi:MAG: peptidoglycan-binding domain-containing protein [Ostreibacterium sp.]